MDLYSKKPKSQTAPQQPNQPPLTLEQQLDQSRMQYQAACELLWEVIKTLAPEKHEATVSPHASDPLWELCFIHAETTDGKPDTSGKIRICAAGQPPMTESEKKRIVRLLRGTTTPIPDAMVALKLSFPPAYVQDQIKDRLVWFTGDANSACTGHWKSVTPPSLDEKAKNLLHLPK